MLDTRQIDRLIATLHSAKTGKSEGPEGDHDRKVEVIIGRLQQLKDDLSRDPDGIDERHLEREIQASGQAYASPYDLLAPAADDEVDPQAVRLREQLGLEADGSRAPGDLARAHRRRMQANLLAAIQAYMDLDAAPAEDGSAKFADLLRSRSDLTAHFQRLHRTNKVQAQATIWSAVRPDDPVTEDERRWLVATLTGHGEAPAAPPKARAAALTKEIKASRAAAKISQDLEKVRRRLVVVREALRLLGEADDVAVDGGWSSGDVTAHLAAAHQRVMARALRSSSIGPAGVVHYNTFGEIGGERGDHPRYTIDYFGSTDAVIGLFKVREGERGAARYAGSAITSGTNFEAATAISFAKKDRRPCTELVEALARAQGDRRRREQYDAALVWLEDHIAELRRHAFALPRSKERRDDPNRLVREIKSLGRGGKHVEVQLQAWQDQVTLLKQLYVHLVALESTRDSDPTRYKNELLGCLGPILTNPGFGAGARRDLQALVGGKLGVESASPRALGEALLLCASAPGLPAEHEHHATQQAIAALSPADVEPWWAKAKLMVETELLELCYLTRMARGDVAARPEVDWAEVSKLVELRIRAANGLVCYVEKLEGAYDRIKKIINWLVGSLNNPESAIRKDYPSVGDAAISLSVGLSAGGSLFSFVSLGLSLTVQISGTITQEDDRRLRFKGSISLGVKASAELDVLAGADIPKSIDFGDTNSEHVSAEVDWIGCKMGVALDKDLASLNGAYVYSGPEQMAAAWAHRIAMFQTYVAAGVAWIPMPGLRSDRGTRRLQVLDPRKLSEEEDKMLRLVAGGDTAALLAELQEPILGARSWRGPLHARDIGLAFDLQLPVPAAAATLHAENYRQKKVETSFWRHRYRDQQHEVEPWAERSTPASGEVKPSPVIIRNWSKSYPPLLAFNLSAAVKQVSAEDGSAGLFDVLPLLDPSKSAANIASLGLSSDLCPQVDLTFLQIDNHPNPDNDGEYVNIKAGRKTTLQAGTDLLGPSAGVSVAWTRGKALNPREAALVMQRVRRFPDGIDAELGGARASAPARLHSYEFMAAFERLAEYGTFELNLVYSGTSRSPRWEIQYGRIWRGIEASLEVGIPVIPGLAVDVGGSFSMNRGRHEILGLRTMTYVQTVYDGLANRKQGAKYWVAYRSYHRAEILALCANVGRDGAKSAYGHNNAHEEVRDDSQAAPPRGLTPGPEQQAQAAVKAKAAALLKACEEPQWSAAGFGGEAADWRAQLAAARPAPRASRRVARMVGNALRSPSTRALSLRVVNDVSFEQSQVWPDRRNRLPAAPGDVRFLFVNPLQRHEIHCVLEWAHNASEVTLELLDKGGAVVWEESLEPAPIAKDEPPAPPPSPAPADDGVASLDDLNRDEPLDEQRRTPSHQVIPPNSPITHTVIRALEPGQAPLSLLSHAAGPYKLRLRVTTRSDVRSVRPSTWAYLWALKPEEVEPALDEYLAAKKAWASVGQASTWGGGSSAAALAAVFHEDEPQPEHPEEVQPVDDDGDRSSQLGAAEGPAQDEPPPLPVVKAVPDGDCFFHALGYWMELAEEDRGRYVRGQVAPAVGDSAPAMAAMRRARARVADHLASTLFPDADDWRSLQQQPPPAPREGFEQHDYVRRFKEQDQGDGDRAAARMLARGQAQGEALVTMVRETIIDLVRPCTEGGRQWGDLLFLAPAAAAAYGRPLRAYQPAAEYSAAGLPADRDFVAVPGHGTHNAGAGGAPIVLVYNRRNHFDLLLEEPG